MLFDSASNETACRFSQVEFYAASGDNVRERCNGRLRREDLSSSDLHRMGETHESITTAFMTYLKWYA